MVRFQAYTPPQPSRSLFSYHVLLGKVSYLCPSLIPSPVLSYHVLLGKVPNLTPLNSVARAFLPCISYHVLLGKVPGLYPSLVPVARAFLPCITY